MEHEIEGARSVEASRGGRRRPRRRARRPRAGRAAQPVQVRRLPLGGRRPRDLVAASTARSTARRSTATTTIEREHTRPRGRVLGAQRRRDRGRARAPAGGALQPVPAHAGHGARRGPRRGRQGRDRPRLRGPLLLGHRDLRRPVPRSTPARAGRARCSTSASACSTRRARGRARSATAARCIRGGRSTARRRRPGTRPAPRSTTSTPTSRTRSATTRGSAATSASCSATAPRRWWRPRGCGWSSASSPSGRFCINAVTGPDEYTTVVDNNAYTNLMAKENLEGAVRVDAVAARRGPGRPTRSWCWPPALTDEEIDGWLRAADAMYLPRHDGIVLQDDGFLERKRWDFEGTRDKHPLLLHFHPLELYRHQVIKQTDVVLATYLVEHHFDEEEMRRTFDYYDPLTTGDSTLSACVQSVVASAVGYPGGGAALLRAGRHGRPRRRARQHRRRHPHRLGGRHLARAGGRLRRPARLRRRRALLAAAAGRVGAPALPRRRCAARWSRST